MSKLSNEYEGRLAVCRIDVRDNHEKPAQYGVKQTPTSLFIRGGEVVSRINGYVDYEKLQAATETVLEQEPAPPPPAPPTEPVPPGSPAPPADPMPPGTPGEPPPASPGPPGAPTDAPPPGLGFLAR